MPSPLDEHPDSAPGHPVVRLGIKAIPNARQSGLAGVIGDRLKVKVTAPPEDGKANLAICRTIAQKTGLKPRAVSVDSGHSTQEKTLRLEGLGVGEAARLLGIG